MKLVIGNKYNWRYEGPAWIYEGAGEGDYKCDDCGKHREHLHWFCSNDNKDDHLKLGSECVKAMKAV